MVGPMVNPVGRLVLVKVLLLALHIFQFSIESNNKLLNNEGKSFGKEKNQIQIGFIWLIGPFSKH